MDGWLLKKNTIIKGTLILTAAGFITRIIGFFYRIYLSNTLGTVNLGIYQLIFPVYGIAFTLYAGGIQTAVSKMVADEHGRSPKKGGTNQNIKRILKTGIGTAFLIAFTLSVLLFFNANFVASALLKEKACAGSLKVLAFVFPFCSITAGINGYYYGLNRPGIPAFTQLFEQLVRVVTVYFIALAVSKGNQPFTCELAVFGVLAGEAASSFFNMASMLFSKKPFPEGTSPEEKPIPVLRPLVEYALPLTGNHLIISVLNSVEAVLIPAMLKKYGMTTAEALSVYGVLTGMSLPFIMFPSTITNSLSVLLLPAVSEANAGRNHSLINQTTRTCIQYCLIIGIFSTGIFIIFGSALGSLFFHNKLAGQFLMILAWLCPFLYLATTLGSIINGLGKTYITLINSVTGLMIRIMFVLYMVPQKGIYGYLIGLLVSTLSIAFLDYLSLKHQIPFKFDAIDWMVKPILIMCVLGFLVSKGYVYVVSLSLCPKMLVLAGSCFLILFLYVIALTAANCIRTDDFH